MGKLSLVDLAGSERAANTKNTGARLIEGKYKAQGRDRKVSDRKSDTEDNAQR